MSYPEDPGFKAEGPSREAALAERERAVAIREGVLRHLKTNPDSTTDECAQALGLSVLAVRPRFSELLAEGFVAKTDLRRRNASGHSATVWRLSVPLVQGDLRI